MPSASIAILGAGSWGTGLAMAFSHHEQRIHLWGRDAAHINQCAQSGENTRYFPSIKLHSNIIPNPDLRASIHNVEDIVIAVPSHGFRECLEKIALWLTPQQHLILASKGLDQKTGELLHEVVSEILPDFENLAVLSGPSFASELMQNLPTAVTLASQAPNKFKHFIQKTQYSRFRLYLSDDIIGAELGGAAKNPMAIAAGISDGLGFGANTRCALITRGLAEMTRLGLALGAKRETFMGLAGMGDLILTCTDDQSRNRRFGLALGKGDSPEQAIQSIGQVVEGAKNAGLISALALKHSIDMPIINSVTKIINGEISCVDAVEKLLSRESKSETA